MGALTLDSSVLLAAFDPRDALHDRAVAALAQHEDDVVLLPVTVLSEVVVAATRLGRGDERRDQVLARADRVVPVDVPLALRAAALRAAHAGLRLPDALVLATADLTGSTVLTGDHRMQRRGVAVEVV